MTEGRIRNLIKRRTAWIVLLGATMLLGVWSRLAPEVAEAAFPDASGAGESARIDRDAAASRAAFLDAYKVLMHPRCMN